ncbi:ABC transporter permease [Dactylosporangium sp. NPDC049140]|jgi:lipooligosaccharide transport system permease protein|uniref:ABC transporter permease n=1 Tax=Dactylosporangium sp. NPDC049140 TaxID=3155647 RepID=UPI0033E140DB
MRVLALREFAYWMLRYRRNWRATVVVSVLNPLLFLLAMGAGLGRLVDRNTAPDTLHGVAFLAFFAPGLLAAATMQTAVIEASRPVFLAVRPGGSYRNATAGPLGPGDVLAGHLLYMALRIATSALCFVLVLLCFPALRTTALLWLTPAALLTGMAFAAPLAAWVATLESGQPISTVFRFVIMPMYMFSGVFFPAEQIPAALRYVVYCTPLWHGTELCRGQRPLLHAAYLGALTVAGVLVARRTYRRRLFA